MSIHTFSPSRFQLHGQSYSSQCFSPTSDYLTRSTASTAWSMDPQGTLLQRWRDMTNQLATTRLSRNSVVALNRYLDEAESLFSQDPTAKRQHEKEIMGLGITENIPSISPMTLNEASPQSRRPDAPEAVNSACATVQMSKNADDLLERVTRAANQLRQRQEDFKHLNCVAIAKAEQAAQKILQLEAEVEQLEANVIDDEAELTYLKLKVRILEIQGLPYMPTREQDHLAEGIRRWKLDWADIENRFHTRRRKKEPDKCLGMQI